MPLIQAQIIADIQGGEEKHHKTYVFTKLHDGMTKPTKKISD